MLKKFIYFHLIPFILVSAIAVTFIYFKESTSGSKTLITGQQTALSGKLGNLLAGDSAEINYIASIQNSEQLTIFGSSEFTNSPMCAYNFFPDSLGIQMLGIGHAYHQSLSILTELLAADEYIDSSNKMCFIISPGWFTTDGTNTEAFIEFARPNFMQRIANSTAIPDEHKSAVGKYISDNQNGFEGLSPIMEILINQYSCSKKSGIGSMIAKFNYFAQKKLSPAYIVPEIKYNTQLAYLEKKKWPNHFDSIAKTAQETFINSITTNKLYVYDEYYTKYLGVDGKPYTQRTQSIINKDNNIEFNQFMALLNYLKFKGANASFVIIPLNPYCYSNLDQNAAFFESLSTTIEDAGFTSLNMYASDTTTYQKGVLKDVMHLGDFGWIEVNKFIFETHYEATH